MDYLPYLEKMKNIEENILEFVDNENSSEEDFSKLSTLLSDQSDKYRVKEIIRLIINISNEHHRTKNFFNKIERIILLFTNTIQHNFSQHEIFNIFVSSKRLLLFLFEQKLITPDTYVIQRFFSKCISDNDPQYIYEFYPQYFYPEIKDFYDKMMAKKDHISSGSDGDGIYPGSLEFLGYLTFSESFQFFQESFLDYFTQYADDQVRSDLTISDEFMTNRKIGENDKKICQLIRDDQLNDFIEYINQENIPVKMKISPTLFETNRFISISYKEFSLIEYSAFCGSLNIFKYLLTNNAKLKKSIWLHAIHGKNSEIIHLIEDKNIKPEDETYEACYYEAIKCFHYEIADYIKNNYMNFDENNEKYYKFIIKHSNYSLFNDDFHKKKELFTSFCQYDYFEIARDLIEKYGADINSTFVDESKASTDEKSAIHDAIENEKIDFLKFLLSKSNIDVNLKRKQSLALYGAFHREVKMTNITTPLTMAVLKKNHEMIKLLLDQKEIDLNVMTSFQINSNKENYFSYEESPLIIAIDNKDIDTIKLLLSNEKTDVNLKMKVNDPKNLKKNKLKSKSYSPFHLALLKNDKQITDIFLTNPKVKIEDFLLETAAFEQDNLDTFKALYDIISKRSILETKKVLEKAIISWDSPIIKVIIDDKNTNVNIKIDEEIQYERRKTAVNDKKLTKNYEFLLQIAISKEDVEIIELLLKHEKVDVNCLSLIQKVMEPVYLKKPLRQVIKIETRKKTPLLMAVELKNVKIVQLLLSYKTIDVNAKSELIKEEISYHSLHGDDGGGWVKDGDAEQTEYKTALQLAEEIGNQEIINILQQHLNK